MMISRAHFAWQRSTALTMVVVGLGLLCSTVPAFAIKVKVYTLAELVQTADAIVRAEIQLNETATNAVVEKTLKGTTPEKFAFKVLAYRPGDLTFTNGQKALLFVQRDTENQYLLVGYGDQAVWPKHAARWPYSKTHVTSMATVEDAVGRLLRINRATEDSLKVSNLQEMLRHSSRFLQVTALEFLEQTKHERLAADCRKDINLLAESPEDDVRQPAAALKSAMGLPGGGTK